MVRQPATRASTAASAPTNTNQASGPWRETRRRDPRDRPDFPTIRTPFRRPAPELGRGHPTARNDDNFGAPGIPHDTEWARHARLLAGGKFVWRAHPSPRASYWWSLVRPLGRTLAYAWGGCGVGPSTQPPKTTGDGSGAAGLPGTIAHGDASHPAIRQCLAQGES